MRNGLAAVLLVIAIIAGTGAGYLTGYANERTDTLVSTSVTTSTSTTTLVSVSTSTATLVSTEVQTTTRTDAQIHTLQLQLSQLENQSALMRLEISLLGQVSGLGINAFAVNETWTVQPNSTILVSQEVNQYNGSLVFICYSACPNDVGSLNNANGEKGMTLWLDNSTNPISPNPINFTISENVPPQEWAVYLRNIGSTPIQFTGSLYYVYQVPCTLCVKTP